MFRLIENANSSLKVACVLSATALSVPTMAGAQEVTLQTRDGNTVSGQLIEFADNIYVIDSVLGRLNVQADQVECIGAACPSLAASGPVVWDVSLWGTRRAFTEHLEKLAELVDAKTDGDFTLNLTYGGLAEPSDNLEGIAAGSFEMAQFCAGYHPEKNPALNVLELPFLGVQTLEQELAVSWAVYGHPATQADMARYNATILMPTPLPQQNIMGTGQPPTSLVDFQTMAIRATGGIGDAVAALGAEPVSLPAAEAAEAMASGDLRAVSFAPHEHVAFGTIENGSWWTTNLDPGTVNCPVVMHTPALGSLSDEHRDALLSSVDESLDHFVDYYNDVTLEGWSPALEERGIIQLTFGPDILATINSAVAAPSAANWIIQNTIDGLPAEELYALVRETLAEF